MAASGWPATGWPKINFAQNVALANTKLPTKTEYLASKGGQIFSLENCNAFQNTALGAQPEE
jgi:hypothetical protein